MLMIGEKKTDDAPLGIWVQLVIGEGMTKKGCHCPLCTTESYIRNHKIVLGMMMVVFIVTGLFIFSNGYAVIIGAMPSVKDNVDLRHDIHIWFEECECLLNNDNLWWCDQVNKECYNETHMEYSEDRGHEELKFMINIGKSPRLHDLNPSDENVIYTFYPDKKLKCFLKEIPDQKTIDGDVMLFGNEYLKRASIEVTLQRCEIAPEYVEGILYFEGREESDNLEDGIVVIKKRGGIVFKITQPDYGINEELDDPSIIIIEDTNNDGDSHSGGSVSTDETTNTSEGIDEVIDTINFDDNDDGNIDEFGNNIVESENSTVLVNVNDNDKENLGVMTGQSSKFGDTSFIKYVLMVTVMAIVFALCTLNIYQRKKKEKMKAKKDSKKNEYKGLPYNYVPIILFVVLFISNCQMVLGDLVTISATVIDYIPPVPPIQAAINVMLSLFPLMFVMGGLVVFFKEDLSSMTIKELLPAFVFVVLVVVFAGVISYVI